MNFLFGCGSLVDVYIYNAWVARMRIINNENNGWTLSTVMAQSSNPYGLIEGDIVHIPDSCAAIMKVVNEDGENNAKNLGNTENVKVYNGADSENNSCAETLYTPRESRPTPVKLYCYSFDSEYEDWSATFLTIEDALAEAKTLAGMGETSVYVGECMAYNPKLHANEVIELLTNDATESDYDYDAVQEAFDFIEDADEEDLKELSDCLSDVLHEWLIKHKHFPNLNKVVNIRKYNLYEDDAAENDEDEVDEDES